MASEPDPVDALRQRRRTPLSPSDTPLVWVACAAGCGAIAAWSTPSAGWMSSSVFATGGVGLALLAVWATAWSTGRLATSAAVLLGVVALVASTWAGLCWRYYAADDLGRFARRIGGPVAIEAEVLEPGDWYAAPPPSPYRALPATERSVLLVRVTAIRHGADWRLASGRCHVTVLGERTSFDRGDQLRIFGQLRAPMPTLNVGQADSARLARRDRRLAGIWTDSPASVEAIHEQPRARGPLAWFDGCRERAAGSLDVRLSDGSTPIAKAMLLGERGGVSPELLQAFQRTGTVHTLVVSGLHVGIVASIGAILAGVGAVGMRTGLLIGVGLAATYALLVGADPPALRATAMVAVVALAVLKQRTSLTINALAAAALLVFALSPGEWLSTGTQLSFLATATLIGFGMAWSLWARREREPLAVLIDRSRPSWSRSMRQAGGWLGIGVAATAVVLCVTGPLVTSRFHFASPGSLLTAPVAALCVPLTLYSGGLLCVTDALLVWTPAGVRDAAALLPAWLCDVACSSLRNAVTQVAETPGAWFATAGIGGWRLATLYLWLCGASIVALYTRTVWPAWWRLGLAGLAIGFVPVLVRGARAELDVEVLAVGHGCSTLLTAPGGASVLIDAGSLGEPSRASDTIANALWARGVQRLDAVVLSHADVDHFNALPGLIERFPIGSVWCSYRMFDGLGGVDDRSAPAELQRLLDSQGIPIKKLQRGDRLKLGEGGARLEVLHPDDLGVLGSDNANSLVLGATHAGRRVLLAGDLEDPGLEQVLRQEPYDCDVLLAPHHGSPRSNPPGFARWCDPEWVLVSSGKPAPETAAEYRSAGAKVLNTFSRGALRVRIGKEAGLQVAAFRPETPQRW